MTQKNYAFAMSSQPLLGYGRAKKSLSVTSDGPGRATGSLVYGL